MNHAFFSTNSPTFTHDDSQVIVVKENCGASAARNLGLEQASGTYVLFLDDDIVPDTDLLDAYIGATLRYPTANVLVGTAALPQPVGLWQCAVASTQLAYFYTVASDMRRPPWGVTANLCVRRVLPGGVHHRFDTMFPKTGGGEDVDFCWQYTSISPSTGPMSQPKRGKPPVAVPGARVTHPWWNAGHPCIGHIVGWSTGETLLPDQWPDKTYRSVPMWCEALLLAAPLAFYFASWSTVLHATAAVVGTELLLSTYAYYEHTEPTLSAPGRLLAAALGALITATQQTAGMWQHLRRGRVHNLCRRVDWFDGHRLAWRVKNQREAMVRFILHLLAVALVFNTSSSFNSEYDGE